MKKFLSLMLALVAIATTARAQFERVWLIDETNFPDQNFREYVLNNIDTDGGRSLTMAERDAVTSIDLSSMAAVLKRVSNLTGIELFKNLTYLDCSGHLLESLDLSQNTALTYLDCSDNSWKTTGNFGLTIWESLSSLNVSQNTALTYLDCSGNSLTSLSLTNNTALTTLKCRNNSLTTLSLTRNTALQTLDCSSNSLTSLSVSNCLNLTTLNCNNNDLTSLSLTRNTALQTLDCGNNSLTSLSLTNNTALTTLYCYRNKIKDANMTALVNSLPTVSGGNFHVIDTDYSDEENVITALQVKVAKEKGWTVYDYHPTTPTEYSGIVVIDEVNFPDANFRNYLLAQNYGTDGIITPAEIDTLTTLNVSYKSIADLTGIEHFTALQTLDCHRNKLTALDVSQNTALTRLECYNNQIGLEAMWALVESLPNVESGQLVVRYHYILKYYKPHPSFGDDFPGDFIRSEETWDLNTFTQSQRLIAGKKGWNAKRYVRLDERIYINEFYVNNYRDFNYYNDYSGEGDEPVVLDETSTEAPTAANGVNVFVFRTINAGEWGTICLPFAMTAEQVTAAFGSDVKLCDFTGCDITENSAGDVTAIDVNFSPVTVIEANHPYIIKVSSPVEWFEAESVDIAPVAEPSVQREGKKIGSRWYYNSFVGTYVAQTTVPDPCLFLSGGQFYYSKGLTKMKGYRAYFDFFDVLTEVENAASAKIGFNIDGETTSLNEELRMKNEEFDNGWYTLDGIKLNGEPKKKGLYIHNGKKVKK